MQILMSIPSSRMKITHYFSYSLPLSPFPNFFPQNFSGAYPGKIKNLALAPPKKWYKVCWYFLPYFHAQVWHKWTLSKARLVKCLQNGFTKMWVMVQGTFYVAFMLILYHITFLLFSYYIFDPLYFAVMPSRLAL